MGFDYIGQALGVPHLTNTSAAAFTPADLPNLALWLDSSDTSTLWQQHDGTVQALSNGDVIGRWDDKSGNDYHVLQSTTSLKPLKQASGIKFDGSDDRLEKTGVTTINNDDMTYFFVGEAQTSGNGLTLILGTLILETRIYTDGDFGILRGDGANWDLFDTTSAPGIGPNIYVARMNGSAVDIFINGGSDEIAGTSARASTASATIRIGYRDGGTRHDGHENEHILYNAALSDENIAQVTQYLASKWGISI